MKLLAVLIYNFLLYPLIFIFSLLGAMFNVKLREGISGRFKSLQKLKLFNESINNSDAVYWFHAASFGEYEQIKPVLSGLKEIEPNARIIVSFFSPSGYNHVNDIQIDCKIYLPFDFPWTIAKALKLAQPRKLIFAAYDIWPNLIWTANKLSIQTTLFAARFVKGTNKLKPFIIQFYQTVYPYIKAIYTVDNIDYQNVQKMVKGKKYLPLIRVLGNPRYDQVKSKADEFTVTHTMNVLERKMRIIAGSMHSEDEAILFDAFCYLLDEYENVSLVWVPHEPNNRNQSIMEQHFNERGFSCAHVFEKSTDLPDAKVIMVNVVGILSQLYWQGQIAYVGGGFSTGVHNTMEPAIARLPVLFGPNNSQFHVTGELLKAEGGFEVHNGQDVKNIIVRLLTDRDYFLKCSYAATHVIHQNIGAATRVVRGIIRD